MCNVHGRWGAKGWGMYGCVGCGPAQAKAAKYATTTQPSVHDYTEHTPLHTPQQTVQDTCASPRIPARARGFTHTPARPICTPTHSHSHTHPPTEPRTTHPGRGAYPIHGRKAHIHSHKRPTTHPPWKRRMASWMRCRPRSTAAKPRTRFRATSSYSTTCGASRAAPCPAPAAVSRARARSRSATPGCEGVGGGGRQHGAGVSF